jgi:hypothetical protein
MRVRSGGPVCALFTVLAAGLGPAACGASSSGGGFGGTGDDSASPSTASDDGPMSLATGDDSAALHLPASDASMTTTQSFNCQPGTYTGPFTTKVTSSSDAGGLLGLLASLFQYPWSGTLSITLQGTPTKSQNGESFYSMLTIAPGAKMSGTDQQGGHFNADISGTLDCTTGMLTGALSNGTYEYPGDAGSIMMTGTLSATYDAEGGTPTLNGTLTAASPQYQGIGAAGTWSAVHQ